MTQDLIIERQSLGFMKRDLETQEAILCLQLDSILQKKTDEAALHKNEEDYDAENDPIMVYYQTQDDTYNSQKDGIESQLKIINPQIESLDKAIDTNVKSECKLSISV